MQMAAQSWAITDERTGDMSTVLARVVETNDAAVNHPDRSEFPFPTNVMSLQARRDLRRSGLKDDRQYLHAEFAPEKLRLKLLLDLGRAAVSNHDSLDLMRAIMTSIRSALISDGVSIFLKSPNEDELVVYALDFLSGDSSFNQPSVVPLTGTIADYVLKEDRAWAGSREQACESFQNQLLFKQQFSTGCMLRLAGRNRVVGALGLVRLRHNPYTGDELDFLGGVANQVALALENAFATREITRLKETMAQEKLYLEQEIRSELNFDQIVGESPALRQALEMVQTVAPSNSTVLLLGETGTGKELIARAIHDHSRRTKRTFVKLNCAAIPTGLFESELFGHEKGAFTGAISQKMGRLELADQGTLFLDEVGDVPLEIQPKLLRALQEREFERLGSTRTKRVDVRLVAATNRHLEDMIATREFRSDLYYRLNVFPIRIPALRERREDIPVLARYFAQKFSRQMEKQVETIPAATMRALTEWDWPGNVRELGNFIERAVILTRGRTLDAPLGELQTVRHRDSTRLVAPQAHADIARIVKETINALDFKKGVDDEQSQRQRDEIVRTLRACNGRVGGQDGTAARLGINRTTLLSRMKKLGIHARQFA
jgi:formate hydrogenlyase transcriptional activator